MSCAPHDIEKGFTLIELLISMVVGLIVLGALVSTFIIQRRSYDVQEQVTEMLQNARAAMDMMSREIRMAGYQVVGTVITNQGSNSITFLGDIDSDIITTIDTNPANSAATSISVNLDDSDDYVAESDYIYITDGTNTDFIQVDNSPGSPDPFSVSGEPDTINLSAGLTNSYSVGSLVQTVEEVTYDLSGTTLRRNSQPISENIESLVFTYGSDTVTIQLTARTEKQDRYFGVDGYRRKTLTSTVNLRNP